MQGHAADEPRLLLWVPASFCLSFALSYKSYAEAQRCLSYFSLITQSRIALLILAFILEALNCVISFAMVKAPQVRHPLLNVDRAPGMADCLPAMINAASPHCHMMNVYRYASINGPSQQNRSIIMNLHGLSLQLNQVAIKMSLCYYRLWTGFAYLGSV